MDKKIMVGNDIFDKCINNNGYYVDKTELIYELAAKNFDDVTLFTRPRRFGKTLTMSMLESFFDISRDSHEVFRSLRVYRNHPDFCKEWMNQYPVLFITLKDVEGMSFEDAYEMLKNRISVKCSELAVLADNPRVTKRDLNAFLRLLNEEGSISDMKSSLDTIMRLMHAAYGKPVILLIDEYDVPLARAKSSGDKDYYDRMLDVIRGIMSISLKTNEHLKFAVITGCLRISKESIFTGVNNFSCYTVTNNRFSEYFGFTEDEVSAMLDSFGQSDKMGIIREWYDGYIFGDTAVFCPWDVMNYLSSALYGEEEPRNYWANTSSNSILDSFVNHGQIDASEKFEALLNGGTITEEISEELTYADIGDTEKCLWSVLLMTGYLTKADTAAPYGGSIRLRIPNAEIRLLFRDAVVKRFVGKLDPTDADRFLSAMWEKDEKTASETLSNILWDSISFFDYGEDYYHGMLNGIFTSRGFRIDSNDESGLGRLDLRVRDRPRRRALLMEFKRTSKESDLETAAEEAISQILRNGYDKALPEGYETQLVYGIAFYKKKALVKLMASA